MCKSDKHFIGIKENLKIISFAFPLIIAIIFKEVTNMLTFTLSWMLIIFWLSNIRRLSGENLIIHMIRSISYYLIYCIVGLYLILKSDKILCFNITLKVKYSILISISVGLIYLYKNKMIIKLMISRENILSMSKKTKLDYILYILNQTGAAICEEIYFRGYLMYEFRGLGFVSIFISTIYFWLSHFLLPWSKDFSKSDFYRQIYIGFLLSILYFYSKSLLPSIMLHLIINMPNILLLIRSFKINYFDIKRHEEIMEDEVYDELI